MLNKYLKEISQEIRQDLLNDGIPLDEFAKRPPWWSAIMEDEYIPTRDRTIFVTSETYNKLKELIKDDK